MTQATELRELATLLDISSGNVGIGLPSGTASNKLVISDGVRTSAAITAGTTALEIARTGGGDVGILINKDIAKWLIGIDNSDGNAAPLRFMYGAYNAAAHPGFGADYSGLNLTYDGKVGIGTKVPNYELHVKGAGDIKIEDSAGGSAHLRIGASTSSLRNSEWKVKVSGSLDEFHIDHDYTANNGSADVAVGINVFKLTSDDNVEIANDVLTNNAKLKAIAKDIPDTALDVFVYDTRKDSDGGAWRHRTQNTSWYNEALNTSVRGARKEFPSVAVIVAESAQVTIYDGDDPDIPMWMVFNAGGGSFSDHTMLGQAGTDNRITVLNAVMGLTARGGQTLVLIDFLKETSEILRVSNDAGLRGFHGTRALVNRNVQSGEHNGTLRQLISNQGNDIAMTVLPNAPIDADTGLPVPTIAVATDGGVSVIKDDGTIVDITVNNASYTFARRVNFLADNSLGMGIGVSNGIAQESYYIFNTIPKSNNVITVDNIAGTVQNVDEFYAIQPPNGLVNLQLLGLDTNRRLRSSTGNSFASDKGLSIISRNVGAPDEGLISYIASDYNTGWMNGDIKLATLSHNDTTNAVGAELITNSTSFSNTTGWYLDNANTSSGTIATIAASGSNLVFTHSNTNNSWDGFGTSGTFVVGQTYTIDTTIVSSTNINVLRITTTPNQHAADIATTINSAGTHSYTFKATATTMYFHWNGYYTTSTITLSKFSVRLAEADRSYNNTGIPVYGTVTKTVVATGAELVGYSGWGSNTYMRHTSSTNYGSPATISFMCWMKTTNISNYQYMGSLIDGTSGNLLGLSINASSVSNAGRPYLYDSVNSSLASSSGPRVDDGAWHCIVGVLDGTSKKLYIDGLLNISSTITALAMTNVTNTNVGFYTPTVGGAINYPHLGSIALWRTSATAPTAEQVAKMYYDEKYLFQENAKATIAGTSDAVIALAYDDDTELLHAGSAWGRSSFRGLNRVEFSTDVVTTVISASNGLVAED